MLRITIVAARIYGEPDADLSVVIPLEGEIPKEIQVIPDGRVSRCSFEEYHCRGHLESTRAFPAVKKGNLYMLWIEERGEWVGIEYEYNGHHFEGEWYGIEEDIHVAGPFRLNHECAQLILGAYKNPPLPVEKVLHSNPFELEGLLR